MRIAAALIICIVAVGPVSAKESVRPAEPNANTRAVQPGPQPSTVVLDLPAPRVGPKRPATTPKTARDIRDTRRRHIAAIAGLRKSLADLNREIAQTKNEKERKRLKRMAERQRRFLTLLERRTRRMNTPAPGPKVTPSTQRR